MHESNSQTFTKKTKQYIMQCFYLVHDIKISNHLHRPQKIESRGI